MCIIIFLNTKEIETCGELTDWAGDQVLVKFLIIIKVSNQPNFLFIELDSSSAR